MRAYGEYEGVGGAHEGRTHSQQQLVCRRLRDDSAILHALQDVHCNSGLRPVPWPQRIEYIGRLETERDRECSRVEITAVMVGMCGQRSPQLGWMSAHTHNHRGWPCHSKQRRQVSVE